MPSNPAKTLCDPPKKTHRSAARSKVSTRALTNTSVTLVGYGLNARIPSELGGQSLTPTLEPARKPFQHGKIVSIAGVVGDAASPKPKTSAK